MAHLEWQEREFWDGTTAIFINNYGRMSCHDIHSDKLRGIINKRIAECDREKSIWLELQQKYEDANAEASD